MRSPIRKRLHCALKEKLDLLLIIPHLIRTADLKVVAGSKQGLECISDIFDSLPGNADVHCQSLHLFVQVNVALLGLRGRLDELGPEVLLGVVNSVVVEFVDGIVGYEIVKLCDLFSLHHDFMSFFVLVVIWLGEEVHQKLVTTQDSVAKDGSKEAGEHAFALGDLLAGKLFGGLA